MKTILNITFCVLILTIISCQNNHQISERTNQSLVSDTLTTESENTGNKIDYDNTKVIKNIYVTDKNGIEVKQQADNNSKTLGTYEYGTKLDVIEENENWLGIRDRITREFYRNGDKVESTGWEKVYVLKEKTGSINEIALIPSDINIISSLTVNKKAEFFETGEELTEYLSLELIDKPLFDSQKSTSVNFLLADRTENKKNNGVLELKCKDKIVKYIDKPEAEAAEAMQIFTYVGQIESLNKYLIGGSYWESYDFRFIDKTNGEETNTFVDYPYISPDQKHIICIYANPYESTADIELYTILESKIKLTMIASFKNWMPIVDENWMPTNENSEIFWSTDGYLYLTVNHVNSFWKENGRLNDINQYIRIKIL